MDQLLARHGQEQRDLQSRIVQKKKQASKKTRRGISEECERLEAELRQRQADEIAALHGQPSENVADEPLPGRLYGLTLGNEEGNSIRASAADGDEHTNDAHLEVAQAITAPTPPKKLNRQKARMARRAAEQEELVRQAEEEAKSIPDMSKQECERMQEAITDRRLYEHEIRADGHCLYSAVADQLEQLQIPFGAAPDSKPILGYKVVRAAAAEYIERHQDDFVPFLEESLVSYLHKVRDTAEWGGQLELIALAKRYGADINVLQDFGKVERIEAEPSADAKVMWLAYYKHRLSLGAHYNSLRSLAQ